MGTSNYTLNIPVIAGDPRPLKDIAAATQEIASRTRLTSAEFKLYSDELQRAASAHKSVSSAIQQLAKDFSKTTPGLRDFSSQLAQQVRELDAAGSAAGRASRQFQALGVTFRQVAAQTMGAPGVTFRHAPTGGAANAELYGLQRLIFGFNPRLGGLARLSAGIGGTAALAGVVGGAAAIGITAETIRKLAEYGREMTNLSARTGLTVEETQRFSAVAQIAGVNVESLVTAQRTLSRALSKGRAESAAARTALKELGLSEEVAFEKPQQALEDILGALAKVTDHNQQARLAVTLLGRGALELVPLATQFKDLSGEAGRLSIILDDHTIKSADRLAQRFTALKLSIEGVAMGMAVLATGMGTPDQERMFASGLFGALGGMNAPETMKMLYGGSGASGVTVGKSESRSAHRGFAASQRIQSLLSSMSTPRERSTQAIASARTELDAAVERNDVAGVQAAKKKLELLEAQNKALEAGESIEKRRAEMQTRLEGEGSKPGSLARFQYEYRQLRTSPLVSQRAAYARGFNELFQSTLERHARATSFSSPESAIYDSGLSASEHAARGFMPSFEALNPVGIPPASAVLHAQSLQGASRYRAAMARQGATPDQRAILADTLSTLRAEQKAREQELANEKDSVDKLGKIADLRQQYLNKIQDAEQRYNESLAQQSQAQAYGFGGGLTGAVLAAQNGGSRGSSRFFKGFGENIEGTVVTNLAANYIWPMLSKVTPHANSGILGTLLSGTAFGPKASDPLKISMDINSRSADLNTAATLQLNSTLSGQPASLPSMPSASLGGGSGTSSLLSTFGSDIGGWAGGAVSAAGGVLGSLSGLAGIFRGASSGSGGDLSSVMPGAPGVWTELPGSSGPTLSGSGTGAGSGGSLGTLAAVAGMAGAAGAASKGVLDVMSNVPGRKVAGAGELAGAAGGALAMMPMLLGASAALGPIGLGIAAVGGLVTAISSLFGVGPQDRQRDISKNLSANAFMAPMAQNVMMSTNGGYADISDNGSLRTSSLSPFPVVSQPYLDFPRRIVVPGHIISPFGGYSNQTGAMVSPQGSPVNITVQAMDSQSFIDHADEITNAVNHAVQTNFHPLIQNIGQRLGVR